MVRSPARLRRLLVCGFGPFPGFEDNPAGRIVERLRAADWAPQDVAMAYQLIPTTWDGAYATAAQALRRTGADAVLVLGVGGGADGFRVETGARNHAATDKPDAEGLRLSQARISETGPEAAQTPVPARPMIAALAREGLPARASSDAGDYLCNHVFYRLLTEPGAPPAAFLHLPPGLDLDALERGAKAAIAAIADGPRDEETAMVSGAKTWQALAAINGLMGVAAGAFGAHGMADPLSKELLRTGAQYQLIHAVAALACCGLIRMAEGPATWAARLFGLGALVFGGSLYLLALTGVKVLGAITPIGGLLLLAGWAALIWGALAKPPPA